MVLVAAGVLLLAVAEREGRQALAPLLNSTGPAQWIWAPGERRVSGPRAFYAVRDFELDRPPETATVRVGADETYVLWVNGERVGSGCWRGPGELDRYDVAPLLVAGGNRIAVELGSSRGAGGLLLALAGADADQPLLVSDRSWWIFERDHPGILQGWLPQEQGEPAISWGRPPTGRWGVAGEGVPRPLLREVREPRPPWVPRRLATGEAASEGRGGWRRAAPQPLWHGVQALSPLGTQVLFDFGREVTGYLVLAQKPPAGQSAGLVWLGAEPPEPRPGTADTAAVPVPGSEVWHDALPRRFRYVLVLGLDPVVGAWVEPVAPRWLAVLPAPPAAEPRGVFGLPAPPLRTPIEDEVRRKLKGIPGVAGGEDLQLPPRLNR